MHRTSSYIKLLTVTLLGVLIYSCEKEDPVPSGGGPGIAPDTSTLPDSISQDTTLYDLRITISGFENTNGQLVFALFDKQSDFNNENPLVGRFETLDSSSFELLINDLRAGYYGISCYHDENEDEELNTNFFGIPQEGFGFSTNPSIGFSAPAWNDIRFLLSAGDTTQTITLQYL